MCNKIIQANIWAVSSVIQSVLIFNGPFMVPIVILNWVNIPTLLLGYLHINRCIKTVNKEVICFIEIVSILDRKTRTCDVCSGW